MFTAFLLGLIVGSALLIGSLLSLFLKLNKKVIASVMAFGAGVLICSLSFNLIEEAYKKGGFGPVTIGFLIGALIFISIDWFLSRKGGHARKRIHHESIATVIYKEQEISGMAVFFGTLLDNIPEAAVIGVSLLVSKETTLLMVVAVFLSNLPEGMTGTSNMLRNKKSKIFIFLLWSLVAVVCVISSFLGYVLLDKASPELIAIMLALAAGSILTMVVGTIIPEVFIIEKETGMSRFIVLLTIAGFLLTFIMAHFIQNSIGL